jgi:hypothetical protein
VEAAFDDHDRSFEERLSDLWQARCFGVDPSRPPARRVYADAEESLADAWLVRTGA